MLGVNRNDMGYADGLAGRPPRTPADVGGGGHWVAYAYGYGAGQETARRTERGRVPPTRPTLPTRPANRPCADLPLFAASACRCV